MKTAGRYFLMTMTLMAPLSPTVQADTLELKDGRLIEGTYVGGTTSTVRVQIEGRVEVIPVPEVLALTFSPVGSASSPDSALLTAPDEPSGTGTIRVPAGNRLLVRITKSLNSEEDGVGSRFTAILEADLEVNGRVVAPEGSAVYGRLTSAKKGGRAFGKAELQLELTDIVINDNRYAIFTSEYEVQGKSQGTGKKALGGALLGALIDGSDGAKKGAAAGFGLSFLSEGKQVSIPSGTLINFLLQQPLTLHT